MIYCIKFTVQKRTRPFEYKMLLQMSLCLRVVKQRWSEKVISYSIAGSVIYWL